MGVHGLWSVLAPAGQTIPLTRLAGRTLAVDLSGWVCQAVTAKGLAHSVQKPHLRNLFFRVSTFYRLGASLVFVIDGEASQLKWATLDRREGRGEGQGKRRTGRRPQLQRYVNECCNMLDCLGVPYLQSQGEAEALCSVLNYTGLTDGVLTNDSDAFLYGATTVYRDLTTNEKSAQVECYTMQAIHNALALNRRDLVAMALLLGCDYCPEGVMGVGKEKALQFIRACKSHTPSRDSLDCFQQWRKGSVCEGDLESRIEQSVFRKAMSSESFPREEIISEFLSAGDTPPADRAAVCTWKQPRISAAQVFCRHHMDWERAYTAEKTAPLVTQWALRQATHGHSQPEVCPARVVKKCRQNGEAYYQVQWQCRPAPDSASTSTEDIFSCGNLTTVEHQEQMERAFPGVCAAYREAVEEEARAKTELKEQAKALAKRHREEQKAARKTNPRCEKAPPPDTPTLPQVLHEIALKSRTSTLNEISPPLAHLHTHASCSTAVPQCSVHECIHEPTASIDHQAPTLHFSQECTNPDMFTTVRDDSADSDWEENPVPSLRERLVARGKAAQASSRPRTSQTDFLRMMRSVRSNKARCAEANKLEDYGCSSHLKQVSTKLNVTECSPAHLSPPSPTKRTVKPPRYRKSPKKMALARTAEEPIMLSDSSDDELSFFDRLRNTDCKSKCSSDCSSADGSVRRDDTHFTENPATKGTKHDPIVL